ncbi:MAG TPA: acyltransferase, partial [Solirubrobacteraceae bacterium]|nr:acyltransferase [Solirubrobacteraceae bacterium]
MLDGLRGIAIALVMLMHLSLLPNGFMGVDLFFALSGFLITTLLYEEWERTGSLSFSRFYERRARRLLPALLILVAGAVLVNTFAYTLTGWPLGRKALTTLLFANNWVAGLGKSSQLGGLCPTWSLAQEEQFYLVWPLLLVLMLRRRFSPRLVAAALAAGVAGLIWWVSPHLTASIRDYSTYYSPADRSAELLLGCLGAVLWRHRLVPEPARLLSRVSARAARQAARVARPARVALCCVLIYLFARLLLGNGPTRPTYLLACALAVVLIPNLLAVPESLPARLIGCAPLRRLGRISY